MKRAILAVLIPVIVQPALAAPSIETCKQFMLIRDSADHGQAEFNGYVEDAIDDFNKQHVLGENLTVNTNVMSTDDKGSWLAAHCFAHPDTQFRDAEQALYEHMADLLGVPVARPSTGMAKTISAALTANQPSAPPPPASGSEELLVPPYSTTSPWKKITDHHEGGQVWIEWIPSDQDETDIRDILTEQIFPAQKGQSPSKFIDLWLARVRTACRDASRNGPVAQTQSGYDVAYAQTYCVGNSGKDVDIFIKAIAGRDALYVVQREFRRPADPNAVPGIRKFSHDQKTEAVAALAAQGAANDFLVSKVKLCPHGIAGDDCSASVETAPAAAANNSIQINGWPVPGETSASDVRKKLGNPSMQNRSDPFRRGEYVWVFVRPDGYIFTFLFDKNDLVVRMQAYKHTGPG